MVQELKRVVKPNGTIYLSTPNIKVNSPSGIVTNPYHTQEWDYEEFIDILDQHFSSYKLFGQKYCRYVKKRGVALLIETLLYKRGIRKIPINLQNKIMNFFGQDSIYPNPDDYIMTYKSEEIEKCKTFFVICKK